MGIRVTHATSQLAPSHPRCRQQSLVSSLLPTLPLLLAVFQPGFVQVPTLGVPPTHPGVPHKARGAAPALTTVALLRSSVLYVQVVMSSSPWGVQTQENLRTGERAT